MGDIDDHTQFVHGGNDLAPEIGQTVKRLGGIGRRYAPVARRSMRKRQIPDTAIIKMTQILQVVIDRHAVFDTYESGDDLIKITNKLWDFMRPVDGNDPKSAPPEVKFKWASFSFTAVITDMTMKYTLFDKDGDPVRAEVTLSFIQSEDPTSYPHQNPSSGGGPIQEMRKIVKGDRLDLIANDAYGDATKWRHIAEYNRITNPRKLRPGQMLTIAGEVTAPATTTADSQPRQNALHLWIALILAGSAAVLLFRYRRRMAACSRAWPGPATTRSWGSARSRSPRAGILMSDLGGRTVITSAGSTATSSRSSISSMRSPTTNR